MLIAPSMMTIALSAAHFVSKRLQRVALAVILLAAAQLAFALTETPRAPPGAVIVAVGR